MANFILLFLQDSKEGNRKRGEGKERKGKGKEGGSGFSFFDYFKLSTSYLYITSRLSSFVKKRMNKCMHMYS